MCRMIVLLCCLFRIRGSLWGGSVDSDPDFRVVRLAQVFGVTSLPNGRVGQTASDWGMLVMLMLIPGGGPSWSCVEPNAKRAVLLNVCHCCLSSDVMRGGGPYRAYDSAVGSRDGWRLTAPKTG